MAGLDPKLVQKYLVRHAAPEAQVAAWMSHTYDHALVIPACDEVYGEVRLAYESACRDAGSYLIIVVVNGRDDHGDDVHASNRRLWDAFFAAAGFSQQLAGTAPIFLHHGVASNIHILAVDRASLGNRLPAKEGVGRARKIGCDIALALHAAGKLRSPWLHTTDADAKLPEDYWLALGGVPCDAVALAYPFRHEQESEPIWAPVLDSGQAPDLNSQTEQVAARHQACLLYELSLRYYVLGLQSAGSPFAFHTIGSTLAVHAHAYAHVRGVPNRQAGEDFYLLNKLRKLGAVHVPNSLPIALAARVSQRVPFGTGPAVQTIMEQTLRGEVRTLYHPLCFAILGDFLRGVEAALQTHAHEPMACAKAVVLQEARLRGDLVAAAAHQALASLALDTSWLQPAWEHRSVHHNLRQFHSYFDGLKSLRFIHALGRCGLANLPWKEALQGCEFLGKIDLSQTVGQICQNLAEFEGFSNSVDRKDKV